MKTLDQLTIVELKAYIFDLQTQTDIALQVLQNKKQIEQMNGNLSLPPVKTPEEETPLPKK